MKTVYIALGSNLGDRVGNLLLAREQIASPHVRLTCASSIYETAPREIVDQPWFLNQVVAAETTLFPRQLLARLLRIEQEMGRQRTVAKGPRLIDLDILLFGDAIIHTAGLEYRIRGWPSAGLCSSHWLSLRPRCVHRGVASRCRRC